MKDIYLDAQANSKCKSETDRLTDRCAHRKLIVKRKKTTK